MTTKTKLKPFSVLLLYPDYIADQYGEETFYGWTKAKNSLVAIANVQDQAAKHNDTYYEDYLSKDGYTSLMAVNRPCDFTPLLVIKGHHKGLATE
jgi:hypothetical protein